MAFLCTPDLGDVGRAVQTWLIDSLTLREMSQILPGLDVSEIAIEIEEGRGVEAIWNHLLGSFVQYAEFPQPYWFEPEFCALIRAASERPSLRQLVPMVSLGCILLFSRTIGWPRTVVGDLGIMGAQGRCTVVRESGPQLADCRFDEVLDVFESMLPPHTSPEKEDFKP